MQADSSSQLGFPALHPSLPKREIDLIPFFGTEGILSPHSTGHMSVVVRELTAVTKTNCEKNKCLHDLRCKASFRSRSIKHSKSASARNKLTNQRLKLRSTVSQNGVTQLPTYIPSCSVYSNTSPGIPGTQKLSFNNTI